MSALYRYIVLGLILFTVSCQQSEKINMEKFASYLSLLLPQADNVKTIQTTGSGLWNPVLSFESRQKYSYDNIGFCLFHRPYQKNKHVGALKLVMRERTKDCKSSVFSDDEVVVENIRLFEMIKQKSTLGFNILYKLPNDYRGKEYKFDIPLYNMTFSDVPKIGDSSKFNSYLKGVEVFSFVELPEDKQRFQRDRLREGQSCREFNEDCEGQDLCHLCPGGWHEVVSGLCPKKRNRFCGKEVCGGENQYACPNGQSIVADKPINKKFLLIELSLLKLKDN